MGKFQIFALVVGVVAFFVLGNVAWMLALANLAWLLIKGTALVSWWIVAGDILACLALVVVHSALGVLANN